MDDLTQQSLTPAQIDAALAGMRKRPTPAPERPLPAGLPRIVTCLTCGHGKGVHDFDGRCPTIPGYWTGPQ